MTTRVQQISAPELKAMIEAGDSFEFVDVRTDWERDIAAIAGQKPILNRSKKAIANFKLKPNQITGCSVTLRGHNMWEFLQRLLADC